MADPYALAVQAADALRSRFGIGHIDSALVLRLRADLAGHAGALSEDRYPQCFLFRARRYKMPSLFTSAYTEMHLPLVFVRRIGPA